MYCKNCGYFKKGKPKADHSHCTNPKVSKSRRKLEKTGHRQACQFFQRLETTRGMKTRVGSPLISVRQVPFRYYIQYISQEKYFSYLRYGDGEWKALFRESGRNGRAHMITPEFHRDMLNCFFRSSSDFSVFFGMQKNTYRPEGRQQEIDSFLKKNNLLTIPWVSADILHYASRDGMLFPLIEHMRARNSIIVGPKFLDALRNTVFPDMFFIEVPPDNCYNDKEKIYREITDTMEDAGEVGNIITFSCGPATEVFIPELQQEFSNNFYIDAGSLWDVFVGQRTRRYTQDRENYTQEIIKKNLGG